MAAVLAGALTLVFRWCLVCACAELEPCGAGMSGFVCNVINAGLIPTTALLSLAYFGEVLGVADILGVCLVFGAIVAITAAKFRRFGSASTSILFFPPSILFALFRVCLL